MFAIGFVGVKPAAHIQCNATQTIYATLQTKLCFLTKENITIKFTKTIENFELCEMIWIRSFMRSDETQLKK